MKKNSTSSEKLPEIVVGLDIGTTKIATIIGLKNPDGKINVLGYGKGESTGVQYGLIYNINWTVDGINTSKNAALMRVNQDFDEVVAGVAGRHIKSIEYKHPITRINGKEQIIRQEEIDRMIEDLKNISVAPGEQIIDVIPQRFVIDRHRETIDPVGELGEIIDGYFQIITGNRAEINKIINCIKLAGLETKSIILEPIASGLACLSHEEKKRGVVLVDIGGGTTDVAIFVNGRPVFTRVIPVGGNVITKDIATVCRISEELAERLKTTYGTCIVEKSNSNNFITIPQLSGMPPIQISEASLAKIIKDRVQEDILNEIKRAIIESGYASQINNGVVLTGGGSMLRHLRELCQFTMHLPVRIGKPEIGFAQGLYPELKHPMYSTSLGLLKYGIEGIQEPAAEIAEEENESEKEKKKTGKMKKKGGEKKKEPFFEDILKSINRFLGEILEKAT